MAKHAGARAAPLRAFRRRLPLGRAAVLVADGRSHIVGLADISVTGAFLITKARLSTEKEHVLMLVPLPSRVELRLPVRIVRVAQSGVESVHHPHGVAVRFGEIDAIRRGMLEAFVNQATRVRG